MIDHFNIRAPFNTIEQVKDFYLSVFEFEVGKRPALNHEGYWLYYNGQALIHLSVADEATSEASTAYLDHISIRASGLESFRARLDAQGISFTSRYQSGVPATQLFFHDPFGLKLEAIFHNERLDDL